MKEDKRFEEPRGAPREPNLMWIGGLICAIWAVAALAVIGSSSGWLQSGGPQPVAAAQLTESSPSLASRTSCAEFGTSDLRSPLEGVWFQRNCTDRAASSQERSTSECNRTSLDPAEFRLVAPGLYVFSQGPASRAYLWYASSESCFDLVSARAVTVVCADQTVSFNWAASACSTHGGVLAAVNAR
jgi:hypothetical protein